MENKHSGVVYAAQEKPSNHISISNIFIWSGEREKKAPNPMSQLKNIMLLVVWPIGRLDLFVLTYFFLHLKLKLIKQIEWFIIWFFKRFHLSLFLSLGINSFPNFQFQLLCMRF
jgi:hypothetical protein